MRKMKSCLKILIVLIFVSTCAVLVLIQIFKSSLEKPQITPIVAISLKNIVVSSSGFKTEVILNDNAFVLSDYNVEEKNDKLVITISSCLFSPDFNSKWKGNCITYNKDLTNINIIMLQDRESTKEIWNRKQGVVWK